MMMNTAARSPAYPAARAMCAILAAALVGDGAITLYLVTASAVAAHVPPDVALLRLMQWDASNAFGQAAFSGGWVMAGIGQLMDVAVCLGWAALFTGLMLRYPLLSRKTWAWGLAYGVFVMGVMLYVLVPLGHAARMHDTLTNVLRVLIAHTVFFGLPLAITVKAIVRP